MNSEKITLDDGTQMLLRPLRKEDRPLLVRGFESLSRESRYQRFFAPKARLSEEELKYYTEFDGVYHFAVAAGITDDHDVPLEGVGVARYVQVPDEPGVAEVAIVVVDEFQGRGIGKRLLRHLIEEARRQGIRRFTAQVLRTNQAAIKLIASVVGDFEEGSDGAYRVVSFDLKEPGAGCPSLPAIPDEPLLGSKAVSGYSVVVYGEEVRHSCRRPSIGFQFGKRASSVAGARILVSTIAARVPHSCVTSPWVGRAYDGDSREWFVRGCGLLAPRS
ncbi:MAG: GNAT family N-acetyltransferase [Planctomycetota bacterium]